MNQGGLALSCYSFSLPLASLWWTRVHWDQREMQNEGNPLTKPFGTIMGEHQSILAGMMFIACTIHMTQWTIGH